MHGISSLFSVISWIQSFLDLEKCNISSSTFTALATLSTSNTISLKVWTDEKKYISLRIIWNGKCNYVKLLAPMPSTFLTSIRLHALRLASAFLISFIHSRYLMLFLLWSFKRIDKMFTIPVAKSLNEKWTGWSFLVSFRLLTNPHSAINLLPVLLIDLSKRKDNESGDKT